MPGTAASTAPDITAVSVDNDATGTVTFSIATNQPTLASDALILPGIDTDANPATGEGGVEWGGRKAARGHDHGADHGPTQMKPFSRRVAPPLWANR